MGTKVRAPEVSALCWPLPFPEAAPVPSGGAGRVQGPPGPCSCTAQPQTLVTLRCHITVLGAGGLLSCLRTVKGSKEFLV